MSTESASVASTLDDVITTMYRAVSGTAGSPRDWAALESVFHPAARLLFLDQGEAGFDGNPMTLEQYRASRAGFFDSTDFFEVEFRREAFCQGPLAIVYSWYAGRRAPDGDDLVRGVNALQLCCHQGQWRILSLAWFRELDRVGPLPRVARSTRAS